MASKIDVSSKIYIFWDGTKVFSNLNTTLHNSLDKVYNLLKEKKLNINPSKSQVLNIQKNPYIFNFEFKINNLIIFSTKVFFY